ncbi:hypothetical protein ACB098_12G067900 [Castanea mollissima]
MVFRLCGFGFWPIHTYFCCSQLYISGFRFLFLVCVFFLKFIGMVGLASLSFSDKLYFCLVYYITGYYDLYHDCFSAFCSTRFFYTIPAHSLYLTLLGLFSFSQS